MISSQWTLRMALATWVAAATLVAIFALFWRMAYAPPHALWATGATGAVVLAGATTVIAGIRQISRGPNRALTTGIVLLGTAPIVWLGMFLLALHLSAKHRDPIKFNAPNLIATFWAASVGDAEARWRYPRWTEGRHVILLDDGHSPDPARLVAQMDKHIEAMAEQLHVQPPPGRARWVRGPLLLQHGRAMLTWAICDADRYSTELTYLDRHEMAHVVITMLGGVDQAPPMLLCEGWAETQCKSRADLILELANRKEQGRSHSLQELVGPSLYGRSNGPAYHHGGPLVLFLLERYGPEKFLTLYHGVRFESFPADCERILGHTWPTIESSFWRWLRDEASALKAIECKDDQPPRHTIDEVELAEGVNAANWQTIIDGYRTARAFRAALPTSYALEIKQSWIRPPQRSMRSVGEEIYRWVVDGENVWGVRSHPNGRDSVLVTPSRVALVQHHASGRVRRRDERARREAAEARSHAVMAADAADLGHHLPLDPKRPFIPTTRINAIRRPAAADSAFWEIDVVSRGPGDSREASQRLRVDPNKDWLVVNYLYRSGQEHGVQECTLGNVFGNAAAIERTLGTVDENGDKRTLHQSVRELTTVEAQSVREQVEAMSDLRATLTWREMILRPPALAIAWPAAGLMFLGTGVALSRRERCIDRST